jgi:N,N'-diacetyllegionaminate synthase
MNGCFIIAEAGVNHNGSLEIAKKDGRSGKRYVELDAISFKHLRQRMFISKIAPKAEYQKQLTSADESQLEMVRKLEISFHDFNVLKDYCDKVGIAFLSTPFDFESIEFLDSIGMEIFKIPSGEITNLPYLEKIGKLKKKVILSTGMANLGELEDALDILIQSGTSRENITVLHCNTEYPTPYEDVNLLGMITIKEAFKGKVGYSAHTPGVEIPSAAVALGATVIEKHFTLDKNMPGPDHKASLEPHELKSMIMAIRNVEKALGDGIKKPSPSELKNKPIARKSIVAKSDIKKGEIYTEENITVKRPGTGISPMRWYEVLGTQAQRDYKEDELI